jgi:hypothetical protein
MSANKMDKDTDSSHTNSSIQMFLPGTTCCSCVGETGERRGLEKKQEGEQRRKRGNVRRREGE